MNQRMRYTNAAARTAIFIAFVIGIAAIHAHAWTDGRHSDVTRGACKVLPEWQKDMWGNELKALCNDYCLIPDHVYTRPEVARYAMIDSRPNEKYLIGLHLPPETDEGYELLRFFLDKSVSALHEGQIGEAARYTGTICHALEDWSCPAHSVPKDNMFTLFKQFLPPPAKWEDALLHGPCENGRIEVDLGDYEPRLLGTSVEEAAFNLLHESHVATVYARGLIVPIIQGLYRDDHDASNEAQQKAAIRGAELTADACYTLACIAKNRFQADQVEALRRIDIADLWPQQAPAFYMPQSTFFDRPYWGHATPGKILKDGREAVPLRMKVKQGQDTVIETMESGIGAGTRSKLTYLLPTGVYETFRVTVGLHAELGVNGSVVFEIKGDGKTLATTEPLSGTDAAQPIEVALAGITNLELKATPGAEDASANYAIWGQPRLVKKAE